MKYFACLMALLSLSAVRAQDVATPPAEQKIAAGRFGEVTVYRPGGTIDSVAIFVSGDGGWHLTVVDMAKRFTELGALVIGVDIKHYLKSLPQAGAGCTYFGADFENLSHQVQKQLALDEYRVPVLMGFSSGATLVYAALAQSPPGTYAGAISFGFCPDLDCKGAPLCANPNVRYTTNKKGSYVFEPFAHLKQPWVAFQGQADQVCDPAAVDAFAAAVPNSQVVKLPQVGHGFSAQKRWLPQFIEVYAKIVAQARPPVVKAPEVGDLPLVEAPTDVQTSDPVRAQTLALLLTGDGGWAGLDQAMAAEFNAQGIATVGFNTLKYFWKAHTPEQTSADVARVLEYYLQAWNKSRVILVGYSFGADVLPFVARRLPDGLRPRIASINFLGLSPGASFEIHVTDWLTGGAPGRPVIPEIEALKGTPMLCLYGEGEEDSICPQLPAEVAREKIGHGHHFSGEYASLARRILGHAGLNVMPSSSASKSHLPL